MFFAAETTKLTEAYVRLPTSDEVSQLQTRDVLDCQFHPAEPPGGKLYDHQEHRRRFLVSERLLDEFLRDWNTNGRTEHQRRIQWYLFLTHEFLHVGQNMPPTPPGSAANAVTLEFVGQKMLNDAIRPYSTRWHARLEDWEVTGMPEDQWPLHGLCRADLNRMRSLAIPYAKKLGAAAGIPSYEKIVPNPPVPNLTSAELSDADAQTLTEGDGEFASSLGAQQSAAAWAIYLELRGVGASATTDPDEARKSYERVLRLLRAQLRAAGPTPPQTDRGETLESITLAAMDEIAATVRGEKPEGQLINACREAAAKLKTLAGVRNDTE